MKTLLPILCLPLLLAAQESPSVPSAAAPIDRKYHRHDGFYLSLNPGIAVGPTFVRPSGPGAPPELKFTGPGRMLDLKIGWALHENLILSLDVINRVVRGPTAERGDSTVHWNDDYTVNDVAEGFGLTYYFMPQNVFVSASAGLGAFFYEGPGPDDDDSPAGFALHFKVAKEWWVSKNWGLGVAGGYGFVRANNDPSSGGTESTSTSHKIYVLFNTTYN